MKEKISLLIYALGIMIVVSFASCDARYDDTSEPCNTCDQHQQNGNGYNNGTNTSGGVVPTNGTNNPPANETITATLNVKPSNQFHLSLDFNGDGYTDAQGYCDSNMMVEINKWFYYNSGVPDVDVEVHVDQYGDESYEVIGIFG
jgi:hypothetical protein